MRIHVNARHLPSQCNKIINVIKWNINLMHNDVVERIVVFTGDIALCALRAIFHN